MAAGRIVYPGFMPARDSDFVPYSGAKMWVYQNLTTVLATVYDDEGLTTPITNPVQANAAGRFPAIWAEAGTEDSKVFYSVSITSDTGVPVGLASTTDNLWPSIDAETAALILIEGAVDQAKAAADEAQDALDQINDIVANAPDAPSVVNKLNRDGDNESEVGAVLGNLGFVGLGVDPVARPALDKLRDVVSVLDYGAKADGVTSDTLAIRRALSAALLQGKELWFPGGDYIVDDLIINGDTRSGIMLRGEGPEKTRIIHRAPGKTLFQVVGTLDPLSAGATLTAPASRGDVEVEVDSTTQFSAEQYIVLQDPSQPVISGRDGSTVCDTGQVTQIREVVGATTLILWNALEFDYTTATKTRRFSNLIDGFSASGIHFINEEKGSLGAASGCFSLFRTRNVKLSNLRFTRQDEDAIRMDHCIDFECADIQGFDLFDNDTSNPYLINVANGSCNGRIHDCFQRGGRHLVTSGSAPGLIETAHVIVCDSMVTGNTATGFDVHPGARHWSFSDCQVHASAYKDDGVNLFKGSGFQLRGRFCTLSNPTVVGCEYGVYAVYGEGNIISGGQLDSCKRGVTIQSSRDNQVRDLTIRNPIVAGVEVIKDGAAPAMPGNSFDNIRVFGNPSGAAFGFSNWDPSYTVSNLKAPNAATLSSGIPFGKLYGETTANITKFASIRRQEVDSATLNPLVSGQMLLTALEIDAGELLTEIRVCGSSAPTTQTNFWTALYDETLNLLGQSPDLGTTATLGNNFLAYTLVTPIRTKYTGLYYIAVMQAASVVSGLRGRLSATAVAGLAPRLSFLADAGLTTTAPATATFSANSASLPYVGVR